MAKEVKTADIANRFALKASLDWGGNLSEEGRKTRLQSGVRRAMIVLTSMLLYAATRWSAV